MKNSDSFDRSEVGIILRKIYHPDPIVKFMSHKPLRTTIISFLVGFFSLLVGNWLNGSLLWSSPRLYDITFMSSPNDWLYLGLLVPFGLGALSKLYRSLHKGMKSLLLEGIVDKQYCFDLMIQWREKKVIQSVFWIVRYIVPLLFTGFMFQFFDTWKPPGKTIYFMNQGNTPNSIGVLMIFQIGVLTLILIDYLIDTIRIAIFHNYLIKQDKEKPNSPNVGFFPKHPDGAYGYKVFSTCMNWAGIFGLFVIVSIMVSIISNVAVLETMEENLYKYNPLIVINSIIILALLPWTILGPMIPFIVMLFRRKREYLSSLRIQYIKNESDLSASFNEKESFLKEWRQVNNGRPYIMKNRAVSIYTIIIILTQIINNWENLISLARSNLGL